MQAFARLTSRICPLDMADVDTDQILPKQFLKRTERAGFGPFAFFDWRYDDRGQPRPEFPMNREEHQGSRILLAGRNFGCGSSREHAPWALQDTGFDVIIAPSFADIFRANCANIGVLTVDLDESEVRALFELVAEDPSRQLTVDLEQRTLTGDSIDIAFEVDPHLRYRLLEGLDTIDLSLQHEDDITAFENNRPPRRPTMCV